MFLSTQSLNLRAKEILGSNEVTLNGNSFVLHLGREAATSCQSADKSSSVLCRLEDGEPFVVESGQLAYLLTEEDVEIPDCCMGFISLDTQVKFRGLDDVSGFHVSPGYKGKLVFAVSNESTQDIILRQGDGIFRLWLTEIEAGQQKNPKQTLRINSISSDMLSRLSSPRPTVLSLEKRVQELERIVSGIKWLGASFLGALIAVLITIFVTWIIGNLGAPDKSIGVTAETTALDETPDSEPANEFVEDTPPKEEDTSTP